MAAHPYESHEPTVLDWKGVPNPNPTPTTIPTSDGIPSDPMAQTVLMRFICQQGPFIIIMLMPTEWLAGWLLGCSFVPNWKTNIAVLYEWSSSEQPEKGLGSQRKSLNNFYPLSCHSI